MRQAASLLCGERGIWSNSNFPTKPIRPRQFHPSLKDHLHALGVVAANYNHLEFAMQCLFWHFSGLDYLAALHLFSDLNVNKKRLDNLKRFVDSNKADPAIEDHLQHFITGFDICADNRNLLMHGKTMDAQNSTQLIMQKYARGNPPRGTICT